jgi:hypothetical protein
MIRGVCRMQRMELVPRARRRLRRRWRGTARCSIWMSAVSRTVLIGVLFCAKDDVMVWLHETIVVQYLQVVMWVW